LQEVAGTPIFSRIPSAVFFTALAALSGCGNDSPASDPSSDVTAAVHATVSPPAACGPGSLPEGPIQGEVPLADRLSGRNSQGYRCNLELVGQYQGQGASWVNPSFDHCAYMATSRIGRNKNPSPGVQVVDASDPASPVLSETLTGKAMFIGPWESLKVNESRKLLGAAAGGALISSGYFDVYDLSQDCAHPVQLNVRPLTGIELRDNGLGHEGNWSPDGLTYWSSGLVGGALTAIDVSNTRHPTIIYRGHAGARLNHGLALSHDGKRLYIATGIPAGLDIYDVSDIQNRAPNPLITLIGEIAWNNFGIAQHPIPVTYQNRPYLIVPDEALNEGIHFIDISDEAQPKVVSHLVLQIQLPENKSLLRADTAGDGFFQYESHYCSVDRVDNPTALACGFFQSGVRVFNIVDPLHPKEVAYFNPPAQVGKASTLPGSEHAAGWYLVPPLSSDYIPFAKGDMSASYPMDGILAPGLYTSPTTTVPDSAHATTDKDLSADWCSSPPRFVDNQLWVTCQDNGFMVLQFTNGAYPIQ
jgi:hypothetical protein